MTEIANLIEAATRHSGVTRRALAARADVAPETVSRICARGTGDFATVSSLVRSAGLRLAALPPEAASSPAHPSDHARLDARSLTLHAVIAGRLLANPALIEARVLPTIRRFRQVHAGTGSEKLLEQWERAALAGVAELVRLCVDPSEAGRQLRQASPMTGILQARERRQVYEAFAA